MPHITQQRQVLSGTLIYKQLKLLSVILTHQFLMLIIGDVKAHNFPSAKPISVECESFPLKR